ncbi:hypothetical protein V0288_23425 [Pannus brasiliensis CCIBt3594]|uniref:Uncharacterized protein n=1 Tax=Pannus brasiliensis CCIBt3594 TaxID=1427578 RepID=A0AAW9QQP9_9CHRO
MTTNSNSYGSLPSENISLTPPAHPEARQMVDRSSVDGNQFGAMTGTTDSMILPRAIAFVEVEPSPSMVETIDPSPNEFPASAGFSFLGLGLVACGAIFIHQFLQKKKSSDRVVEDKKNLPIDLSFFFDRSLPAIPAETRFQHDRALMNANLLAGKVLELDSDRFREADFISFVRLKYGICNHLDEYRDLDRPIQRLERALKSRDFYRSIERVESTHQAPKQQEFYRSVAYLLAECPDRESFRCFLRDKLEELTNSMDSERDISPLLEYFQAIDTIIADNFGFTLLISFKNPRSNVLFTLSLISDLLDSLEVPEENTERTIADFVYQQREALDRLHSILALKEPENSLENLLKILQYLALERRYRPTLDKFERSIALLGEWYLSYQIVIGIRQEYPPTDYQQPKNFSEAIPGMDLYQKYEDSLNQRSMVS